MSSAHAAVGGLEDSPPTDAFAAAAAAVAARQGAAGVEGDEGRAEPSGGADGGAAGAGVEVAVTAAPADGTGPSADLLELRRAVDEAEGRSLAEVDALRRAKGDLRQARAESLFLRARVDGFEGRGPLVKPSD